VSVEALRLEVGADTEGHGTMGGDLGQILQLHGVVGEAICVEKIDTSAPFYNYLV